MAQHRSDHGSEKWKQAEKTALLRARNDSRIENLLAGDFEIYRAADVQLTKRLDDVKANKQLCAHVPKAIKGEVLAAEGAALSTSAFDSSVEPVAAWVRPKGKGNAIDSRHRGGRSHRQGGGTTETAVETNGDAHAAERHPPAHGQRPGNRRDARKGMLRQADPHEP